MVDRPDSDRATGADEARERPPNVVLVLADDLGWSDLGCYGSSFYETPRLDALAAEGALFTDAYASAPVCSPTRASVLTGRYPARVGVTQFIGGQGVGRLCDVPYFSSLPLSEVTMARVLRDAGYRTWHVGKWHLGDRRTWPDRHGFDVNIGGSHRGQPASYFSPYGCPALDDGPDGEYLTDRLTDEAINLVRSAGETPFFLNLWHYAVHTPIQAPPDGVEKYERKRAELGLDDQEEFSDGESYPVWHKRHQPVRRRLVQGDPAYAAMVENLDRNVGRLLDALEETGQAENTIVVFTSDNGGLSSATGSPTCNAPLAEGKGWMYEGGVREPLIVRWPGVTTPGTQIGEPVTSTDFFPTILAAAGLRPPSPAPRVDGVDFGPLLRGEPFERGPIFWHYPHYSNNGGTPAAAVRDGDWKLVHFFEDGHDELYNLREDVAEERNVHSQELRRADSLAACLHDWMSAVQARVPAPNPSAAFEDLPG
ncbi:sulfatase [Phytoactinopolyspora endophytica]|uniref:sulfatase n=1 Tax=Phytoactinopolyspora endophytica TaxID=1642495 RepID=UPI00101CB7EC|nr:sulfatase [Phytoactinopolyspora endophytica]